MSKVKYEQELKSYGSTDGAKCNFLMYGHELRERQKYGWHIKNLVEVSKDTISVLWERVYTSEERVENDLH